jgi:tetratricopeptide (TPR) repeat protein
VGLNRRVILIAAALLLTIGAPLKALAYSQSEFDSVTTEEETQVGRVREQEITQLKIVLGRRFAEARRPDILLRLAELYIERYRFYFFKENQIHQNQYKQGHKPKYVNHERSHAELKAATNACLSILKSRVAFAKLDQVYYFLGYNAEESGKKKEAMHYFEIVAKRYPGSAYAPEAFRNLAEAAFEQEKYTKALGYYEQAARFTNVPSYPRTLYKLAWAQFKNRRKSDALETMKKVIDLSGANDKFVGLRDEALNDIVLIFSEAGRFQEAHDYFGKISGGPEVYTKALSKLSTVYEKRGDYRLAIRVNDTVIGEYGDKRADLVYDALGRNVELYRKLSDGKGEETALTKLVNYYGEHKSEIAKGSNEDARATYLRAKTYLRGKATEMHKEAQKGKSHAAYSRAADLYGLYLKAFLSSPDSDAERREASEIRAYRSDALLASGREAEAIPELERTMQEKGDPKMRREAGATLLNLYIKKLDATHAAGKSDAETERRFTSTAETFEEAFPDDKLVAELRYKRARLAVGKSGPEGISKDARKTLKDLIAKYPARAESADAAHDLVADALKRKDTDEAVALSQGFLVNRPLLEAGKKTELEKYLHAIVSREKFTSVQDIEKDQKYSKAAPEYEKLAAQSNDAEVAAKALNNAAVNYERAGDTDNAIRILSAMIARNPSNPTPREELKRIASQALWTSRFADAAKLYGKLAAMPAYSYDERLSFARTAFWVSYGTGDLAIGYVTATTALRELCEGAVTKKGKKPAGKHSAVHGTTHAPASHAAGFNDPRCHELVLETGDLLLEAGRYQEGVAMLKSYLDRRLPEQRRAEAAFRLGTLYEKTHDPRKAAGFFEEAAQAVPRKGKAKDAAGSRERNFAAHGAFLLVEPYFAKFTSMKLELPEAHLKAITRQKLGALEDLVTRYTNVVAYGDGEWGIAALERIYDAFSTFAVELSRAPVPHGLDQVKAEQYRHGIEQVSAPMASKAVEFLNQGYQKGLQLGVTTPTFIALTQRLARRNPREFPPAHYSMNAEGNSSPLRLLGPVEDDDAKDLLKPTHDWRKRIGQRLASNPKLPDSWVEFGNLETLAGRPKLARLLYEQALALAPKSAAALNNLSVVLFRERRNVEASQGFAKAVEAAEFNKDVQLNYAKALLAFHHFGAAMEHLRPLAGRFPDDKDVSEALAVALLGTGQVAAAAPRFEKLDAEGSKRFSLWYNWCVWALLAGEKGQKEKAMDRVKDRKDGLSALEKSQAEILESLLAASQGGAR